MLNTLKKMMVRRMKLVDDKTTVNVQEEAKFLQESNQDDPKLDPKDVASIEGE